MENSIPERLKPNFTSHIVQIKHTQPQSQKSNSNGLYTSSWFYLNYVGCKAVPVLGGCGGLFKFYLNYVGCKVEIPTSFESTIIVLSELCGM